MERVADSLLIWACFVSTALAQSPQVVMDRHKVLAGWLGAVRTAEAKYKSEHGVYGDLAALRAAHLLDTLIFESDQSTTTEPNTKPRTQEHTF